MGEGSGAFRHVAKKNELADELTYWYGIDAGQLSLERQLVMKANLSRCKAQERILHGRFDPMNDEVVRDIYLTAYGDEELADKMATESAWLQVREETDAAKNEGQFDAGLRH